MSLNYRIIKQSQAFSNLEMTWNSLLKQSVSSSFFLSWDWQWQWWRSFGGQLFIIVLSDQNKGEDIAIFPFICKTRFGFDSLSLIGSPDSDYLDFLIIKGREKQALDFFFNQFLPNNTHIGIVELDAINQRSAHWNYFQHMELSAFNIDYTEKPCPYIELPDSWESYLASLSKSSRYFIGRKIRKIEKTFSVHYGEAGEDDLSERMQHFIHQHQQIWQLRQRPGAFYHKNFQDFHQQIAKILHAKKQLKLLYLEIDNQPVASYYLFREGNAYLYYLSGFDPKYAQYSPSVVLLAKAIQLAIIEGCDEFDLMRGSGAYKYKWTRQQRVNHSWVLSRKKYWVWVYQKSNKIIQLTAKMIKTVFPKSLKNIIRNTLPGSWVKKFDVYFRH